jgi:hypothetical protein
MTQTTRPSGSVQRCMKATCYKFSRDSRQIRCVRPGVSTEHHVY